LEKWQKNDSFVIIPYSPLQFIGSETLPFACYKIFDECNINFYSTSNRYKNETGNMILPSENFAHTSIGNLKNPRNITWPCSRVGQFDNFLSCWVWQRSSANENSTQLIYSTVTCKNTREMKQRSAILPYICSISNVNSAQVRFLLLHFNRRRQCVTIGLYFHTFI